MELNRFCTVLFAAFILNLVQNACCKPRDATIQLQHNELQEINRPDEFRQKVDCIVRSTEVFTTSTPEIHHHEVFAGRVPCQYEEVTEDLVCQEHCLPKGYSYGICVHKTCSCI